MLGASRQQALEHTDADTTQRDANTGQQQNVITGNRSADSADPTDSGGENIANSSNKISQLTVTPFKNEHRSREKIRRGKQAAA